MLIKNSKKNARQWKGGGHALRGKTNANVIQAPSTRFYATQRDPTSWTKRVARVWNRWGVKEKPNKWVLWGSLFQKPHRWQESTTLWRTVYVLYINQKCVIRIPRILLWVGQIMDGLPDRRKNLWSSNYNTAVVRMYISKSGKFRFGHVAPTDLSQPFDGLITAHSYM